MPRIYPYPKSFPTATETMFLKVLLCPDNDFVDKYHEWKASIVFDDIKQSTLRLLPLLYLRLRSHRISDELSGRIKGVYKLVWVKNQRLLQVLSDSISLFAVHGISALTLKGVPLLLDGYKDVGARFLSDADIFIDPSHSKEATAIMIEAGWKLKSDQFSQFDSFTVESLIRTAKEVTFVNDERIEIDLHWRIFESHETNDALPFNEMWRRRISISYRDQHYHTLSPEEMLIHLIVHGAQAAPVKTMRFIPDVVTFVRTHTIDWDHFLKQVFRYHFEIETYFAFRYLLEHCFITIPEYIHKAIESFQLDPVLLRAYYKNAQHPYRLFGGLPRHWRIYWRHEASGRSLRDAARFADYLTRAWGLERKRDLIFFGFRKYRERLKVFFRGMD